MLEEIRRDEWLPYFDEFNERNRLRPTRLEIIGVDGAAPDSRLSCETDFWMENGLPLVGISLEPTGEGSPRIEVMLGGETVNPSAHMTHTVSGAQRVIRTLDESGRECELELEDEDGAVTILHF